MKYIFAGRAAGKTFACVEWLKQGIQEMRWPFWNRILITFSEAERKRLIDTYKLDARQVFTWENWMHRQSFGRVDVELAFDNADLILEQIARHPIRFATFSASPDDVISKERP